MSERIDWRTISVWGLLTAGVVAAFWPLFSFDPQEGVVRAVTGIEGVLFDPSGEDPRLIGVLALWMLFNRRGSIAAARTAGHGNAVVAAALAIAAAGLMAWAAHVTAPDLLIHALQLFVLSMAALVGGVEGMRAVRLPVLFLFLAMPIPAALLNAVLLPLQLATVEISSTILTFFGVETFAVGDQIITSHGIFHVIETCSGVRLVQTLVMATPVYAELFGRRARRTILLLAAAPVIAIAVNLARILSIVFNPWAAIDSVHTTQGVAMVVVGVLLLAGLDRLLQRLAPEPLRRVETTTQPISAGRFDPRLAAAGIVLVVLGAVHATVPRWDNPPDHVSVRKLPRQIDERRSSGQVSDLVFLGTAVASDRIDRKYSLVAEAGSGLRPRDVRLFLAEDDHLNRRASLLSGKTAYPGHAWQQQTTSRASLADGTPVDIALYAGVDGHQVTLHWREGFASAPVEAWRAVLGLDRSRFRRTERALVWRVSTEIEGADEIERARTELLRFAEAARDAWHERTFGPAT